MAGSSDLGLAAVGERRWSWPEPGTASGAFATLIWRGRMLVSLEGTAVEFWEVLAGQALIGSLAGQAGRYSSVACHEHGTTLRGFLPRGMGPPGCQ